MHQGHPLLQLLSPAAHALVAAAVGSLGWTVSNEGGSQLLHHFQDKSSQCKVWTSGHYLDCTKVWGAPAGSKSSKSPGCKVYGLMEV